MFVLLMVACPSCPSALDVRALVSERFFENIWYVVLPFLVVGALVHLFTNRLDRGANRDRA